MRVEFPARSLRSAWFSATSDPGPLSSEVLLVLIFHAHVPSPHSGSSPLPWWKLHSLSFRGRPHAALPGHVLSTPHPAPASPGSAGPAHHCFGSVPPRNSNTRGARGPTTTPPHAPVWSELPPRPHSPHTGGCVWLTPHRHCPVSGLLRHPHAPGEWRLLNDHPSLPGCPPPCTGSNFPGPSMSILPCAALST